MSISIPTQFDSRLLSESRSFQKAEKENENSLPSLHSEKMNETCLNQEQSLANQPSMTLTPARMFQEIADAKQNTQIKREETDVTVLKKIDEMQRLILTFTKEVKKLEEEIKILESTSKHNEEIHKKRIELLDAKANTGALALTTETTVNRLEDQIINLEKGGTLEIIVGVSVMERYKIIKR